MADDIFVGVDVTRDRLDIMVSAAGIVWRYSNDPAGIDRLVDAVTAWSPVLVVVKSSGGYEFETTCALQAAGLAVLVVSPHQVKTFALALGESFGAEVAEVPEVLGVPDALDAPDARMLATLAEALYRQPSHERFAKPLGDAELQRMQALVQRHRQLLALLMAEYQLLTLSHPSVRKGVEQTIGFLKVQIANVERHCAAHLSAHRATLGDALSVARRAGRTRGARGANGLLRSWRLK